MREIVHYLHISDDIEVSEETWRDFLPTTSRRAHGSDKSKIDQLPEAEILAIVPS